MNVPNELELLIVKMNKECKGNEGGDWNYDAFDYSGKQPTYRYHGCRKRFDMCDNCVNNVQLYVNECEPHIKRMNMIISIEKLEQIRLNLLKRAEDILCIINQMKASME